MNDQAISGHKVIEVVCALIRQDGKVLLARRADNGLWELPGGKVEEGESPREALTREIAEELAAKVEVLEACGVVHEPRGQEVLSLSAYHCRVLGPGPQALEHLEIAWVEPQDLAGYDLAPADRRLLGIEPAHVNDEAIVGGGRPQ